MQNEEAVAAGLASMHEHPGHLEAIIKHDLVRQQVRRFGRTEYGSS